jgi:murein DD-endopeptidase MepM/ murein hydrolase activator NlpD
MDSIPQSEMNKPVCGEGQRRVRTSAAAIGLAISMGAATMALPKPSNASVISESNSETREAANEQQPEVHASEAHASEIYSDDAGSAVDSEAQAPSDGIASALMVPSIDKTAVIPEEVSPILADAEVVEATDIATATKTVETQYLQYTVRHNQTLWQIASAYRTSLDQIAQANGISADASLYVGQVLNIPIHDGMNRRPEFDVIADANDFTASRKVLEKAIDVRGYSREDHDHAQDEASVSDRETGHIAYVAPLLDDSANLDSSNEFDASIQRSDSEQIAATMTAPHRSLISRLAPGFEDLAPQSEITLVPSVLNARLDSVHRVASGDTLSSVANRHGITLDVLIAANNIANPDHLKPGQELIVPNVSSASTGLLRGSIAALPSGATGVEATSSIVSPSTPYIAAPASRISAVSRRDRSLDPSLNSPISAASSSTSLPLAEQTTMAPTATVTAESSQSMDYAASLRGDIDRLRLSAPVSDDGDTSDSVSIAAVPATLDFDRDSDRSVMPAPAREMASSRINPEFSARDSVREASTAASIGKLTAEENAISGVVTPSPAPLVASSNVGGDVTETADTIAVAPLGSSNYAPVLPPRSVSPDIPALAAVGEYLPSVGSQFNGSYVWPAQGVLTSGYGWRWGRMHNGIDIGGPTGTPIVAAAPGVVTYARWNSGGYGNLVEVTHPDGSLTLYAHNNRIVVEEGDQVEQGQHIADMGSTGFSTGPHLHFELHSAGRGVVNPVAYLP